MWRDDASTLDVDLVGRVSGCTVWCAESAGAHVPHLRHRRRREATLFVSPAGELLRVDIDGRVSTGVTPTGSPIMRRAAVSVRRHWTGGGGVRQEFDMSQRR